MKRNEVDFLKRFKKLSVINEAVVTQIEDTDDKFPVNGLEEEDANKDAAPAEGPTQDAASASVGVAASGSTEQPADPVADPTTSGIPNAPADSPEAEFDQALGDDPLAGDTDMGGGDMDLQADASASMDPEESEEDIQNELLRIQVSAMRKMDDKITELEGIISGLNDTVSSLEAEVENVREPAPIEKLQGRWEDSYPFKYTLNDLWDGNVFQGRKDLFDDPNQTSDPAIKKTANGFAAEYEDMPKLNDFEIKKSFEVY